jgi:carotenoid cleavage dioxygenase-like enzyme
MNPDDLGFRIGLRSLEREILEPVELVVHGRIPPELRGTLHRMGPARWDIHGERLRHWFDGDGMIHALTLADGRASVRCRFVQHTAHVDEDRAQRRLYGSFGTSPPGGRLRRWWRRKRRRNPANTHVISHAGGLYALCEAGRPWRLDPRDLSTLGEETLGGLLSTPLSAFAAHPRRDPATGDLWGFGVEFGRVPKFHLYRWPSVGAAVKVASVALPIPALIHDFGLTATLAVVVATPMVIPDIPFGLILGQSSYGENLRYRPERGAHIGLIDRTSGEVVWCPTDPFLAFHIVNAFDDGDDVVVDVCAYESDDLLHVLYAMMDGPMREVRGSLWRLRIDRRTRRVAREVLLPRSLEFPRIHDDRCGRPHRQVYGLTWSGPARDPRTSRRLRPRIAAPHRGPARERRVGRRAGAGAQGRRDRRARRLAPHRRPRRPRRHQRAADPRRQRPRRRTGRPRPPAAHHAARLPRLVVGRVTRVPSRVRLAGECGEADSDGAHGRHGPV